MMFKNVVMAILLTVVVPLTVSAAAPQCGDWFASDVRLSHQTIRDIYSDHSSLKNINSITDLRIKFVEGIANSELSLKSDSYVTTVVTLLNHVILKPQAFNPRLNSMLERFRSKLVNDSDWQITKYELDEVRRVLSSEMAQIENNKAIVMRGFEDLIKVLRKIEAVGDFNPHDVRLIDQLTKNLEERAEVFVSESNFRKYALEYFTESERINNTLNSITTALDRTNLSLTDKDQKLFDVQYERIALLYLYYFNRL